MITTVLGVIGAVLVCVVIIIGLALPDEPFDIEGEDDET